ncbi:unnamed protein product (mitochondrion) [Plasmodiophora brassicae]|uniref:Uncharacterized protein n=1 Tax=Plasmodiophora brassicae TaxID=37360 RepID=A0A3P3YP24_PLABS|nr:unnamed protein product [Plasmodiophora brassicae]
MRLFFNASDPASRSFSVAYSLQIQDLLRLLDERFPFFRFSPPVNARWAVRNQRRKQVQRFLPVELREGAAWNHRARIPRFLWFGFTTPRFIWIRTSMSPATAPTLRLSGRTITYRLLRRLVQAGISDVFTVADVHDDHTNSLDEEFLHSPSPMSSEQSSRRLPAFLGSLPLADALHDAIPARPRNRPGDQLDENEQALIEFLQRHLLRSSHSFDARLPRNVDEALPVLEEFARSTLTARSFDSLLESLLNRDAKIKREQVVEFIQALETLPDPDNIIRPLILKYQREVDKLSEDVQVKDAVRKLISTLTRIGLSCPALEFSVCPEGHVFPADRKEVGGRSPCCRGKTEPFYYLPRLIQVQQTLRAKCLADAIHSEISRFEDIADNPRDVYDDWCDGSIFRNVFVPFAEQCKHLLLNTLPRLWSVINPGPKTKSKKRPLYDQKIEESLGKPFDNSPAWQVPVDDYRPAGFPYWENSAGR